jgi:hypothetical protein
VTNGVAGPYTIRPMRPIRWWLLLVSLAAPSAAEEPEPEAQVAQARADWWARQRAAPGRAVPSRAAAEAARAFAALPDRSPAPARTGPGAGSPWASVGPAPLTPTDQFPNSLPAAGRMTAIALHPVDSKVIFVGGALGGVWRSDDAGATWTPLTDGETSLAIGALAIDPGAPDTIYAGTGETPFGYLGHGLLKSTDGGKSWTRPAGDKFTGAAVTGLWVDPKGGAVYLSAALAQDGRGDHCRSFYAESMDYGLWRSGDGGAGWTRLLDGYVVDFEVDASVDPRVLYVAWGDQTGLHAARLPVGGAPQLLPIPDPNGGLVALDLALSPSDPKVIYAAAGDILAGHGMLYVSTDGGGSFAPVPGAPDHCKDQCTWSNSVIVDPTDAGRIYLGGTECSVWRADGANGQAPVWRAVSMPNGVCAAGAANWKQHIVHPDAQALAIDPRAPSTLYVASDGGIHRTRDRGATWEALNGGLSTMQLYGICQDSADLAHRWGGSQDNSVVEQTADGWRALLSGDGAGCVADVTSADLPAPHPLLSTFFAQLFVDGALTFQAFPRSCSKALPGCGDRAAFAAPLARDPQVSSTVYVGTHRVWRSTDGGGTWDPISDDLTAGVGGEACNFRAAFDDYLTALAVAPSAPATIYAGSAAGLVSRTGDGGGSFRNVTAAPLPDRWLSALAVDAADEKVVYAAFSGFSRVTPERPGHVFRSTDGGASWSARDVPLDIPVDSLLAHPRAPGVLYAGTDAGVLATVDGGATWVALDGLPNVPVYGLALHEASGTLVAATYGRGVFTRKLAPRIAVTPPSLSIGREPGGLLVANADRSGSVLAFSAKASEPWLLVSPSAGLAAGAAAPMLLVSVSADAPAGAHDATIEIADPNAEMNVQVPVHVSIPGGCGCAVGGRASRGGALALLAGLAGLALRSLRARRAAGRASRPLRRPGRRTRGACRGRAGTGARWRRAPGAPRRPR